ncbi:MAG TPA: hypothetical protein PKJ63_15750 [Cyclobacteriaceae bacterium]|nr:hypothetical protein [Cyclobacteriaceae bacterium]
MGVEEPIYRERVYCYELYHHLRKAWPQSLALYSLSGEIDKRGHPLIRGNHLDATKPDMLVHIPGEMDRNLSAIEVKPVTASVSDILADLEKLTAYCRIGRYHGGIMLVYGSSSGSDWETIDSFERVALDSPGLMLDKITILRHVSPLRLPVVIKRFL